MTAIRSLHSRAGRRKAGRFVVEGPQVVSSAIVAGVRIHEIYVDEDAGDAFSDIVAAAERGGARLTSVTPQVMSAMSDTARPQGLLAVAALLDGDDLDLVMAAEGPVVVLEGLSDPGNVGTIIRTADAAGAAGVLLTPDSADIHSGKVVRSTAGSLFHLPVLPGRQVAEIAAAAARHGRPLVVTAGEGDVDLFEAADDGRLDSRTCWLIGSEAHGASGDARAAADMVVSIPIRGRAESLNAAVAAAVVLFVARHSESRLGPGSAG